MYTLGMDTIAGAKMLQLKFGRAGTFQPEQCVMHEERRARFIRVSEGAAVIRHCDESGPVAVPLETLSLPDTESREPTRSDPARARSRPTPAWFDAEGAGPTCHYHRRRRLPRP
jgi:hypothetical protein